MTGFELFCFFFFQAEDGIRYAQESRGLGDVYKRQTIINPNTRTPYSGDFKEVEEASVVDPYTFRVTYKLSLIHI